MTIVIRQHLWTVTATRKRQRPTTERPLLTGVGGDGKPWIFARESKEQSRSASEIPGTLRHKAYHGARRLSGLHPTTIAEAALEYQKGGTVTKNTTLASFSRSMKRTQLKQKSTTSTNVVPSRVSRSAATHRALIVSGWVACSNARNCDVETLSSDKRLHRLFKSESSFKV